jgi:FtsZ-interacting cell division protein ZipA
MDNTIPENLSSWIRTVSGAIGILLLSAFALWNSENEKSSTLTQDTKTKEMQNLENLFKDQAESKEKMTVEIKRVQFGQ